MSDKDYNRPTADSEDRLQEAEGQLREIAELEEKYGILGIRFSTKEGAKLTLGTTASYVIDAIKTAADLVERMDRGELSVEEPKEPE